MAQEGDDVADGQAAAGVRVAGRLAAGGEAGEEEMIKEDDRNATVESNRAEVFRPSPAGSPPRHS